MGWTFPYGMRRRELIADICTGWDCEETNTRTVCLAHCYKGGIRRGILWSVWEFQPLYPERPFNTGFKNNRFIRCDMLEYCKGRGIDGWGYKDMCESSGPCYYTCPLKYLKMVPVENKEWRQKVLQHHLNRRIRRMGLRIQEREANLIIIAEARKKLEIELDMVPEVC